MTLSASQLDVLHQRFFTRRAAITGAASGVGRALALELARHNWTLFLNDRDKIALDALVTEFDSNVSFESYVFDVACKADFDHAVQDFNDKRGSIDLLFNAAGIGVGGSFTEVPIDHWREVMDINVMGTVHGCMAVLPQMLEVGRGHLINIASAAAFHAMPHLSAYSASKAAVVALSETLRSELKNSGVNVTVKMTTFYRSNIADHTRGSETEREKSRALVTMSPLTSEQIAQDLLLSVQAKRFYMVAPTLAGILWRFKRFLPGLYLYMMPWLFARLDRKLSANAEIN